MGDEPKVKITMVTNDPHRIIRLHESGTDGYWILEKVILNEQSAKFFQIQLTAQEIDAIRQEVIVGTTMTEKTVKKLKGLRLMEERLWIALGFARWEERKGRDLAELAEEAIRVGKRAEAKKLGT